MVQDDRKKKGCDLDRQVPRKPRLVGGIKGHNINEISFPGSPALIWAGSFTHVSGSCQVCHSEFISESRFWGRKE
jgi:hypothetical protein